MRRGYHRKALSPLLCRPRRTLSDPLAFEDNMAKRLFLHIGHYKTGTTALQVFLAHNPKFLAQNGWEYSPFMLHHAKHSQIAFALMREAGAKTLMHGYSDPTPALDLWNDLCASVIASKFDNVIISTEELMRMGEYPLATTRLAEFAAIAADRGIEVTVIAYLRNPQDHLQSWHNQLVKMAKPVAHFSGALQPTDTATPSATAIEAIHYDYGRALAPWIAAFGAERIILRDYDQARRSPTGLFEDFLGVLGLSYDDSLNKPQGDPNPRLDDRLVELLRIAQGSDLPKQAVAQLRTRAEKFLAAQDALGKSSDRLLAAVRAQSAEGLAQLGQIAQSNLDMTRFAARLPADQDQAQVNQTLMLDFVLQDMITQRRYQQRSIQEMAKRLRTLEEHLGLTQPAAETSAKGEA